MEPGPEADRHWTEFDWIYAIPITRNEIVRLGKDPNLVAKFEDEFWGLGDDAYVGALDVFHQLHCVNALREYAFADFGEEIPTKKKHGNLQWVHLRHCVDILVQNIMCHADAGIHTYNWMDTQPQPFPDFSVNRKCRDFEQLRVYRDMHTVDMEKYKSMPKPKGVKQVSAEPEYYDIFGYEGSDLYPALSLKAQMEREEKERKEAKSS
ncbi:hypothetical protein MMC25_005926 [Agyrium rufum]|nr:hypothetical protein [Agyrium rufum]